MRINNLTKSKCYALKVKGFTKSVEFESMVECHDHKNKGLLDQLLKP